MPYTLLLADDSVTIQRVIELTFADEDVNVVAVSDGDQAIARLESSPPDIVLADIGMPGKNGYEVAQYIRDTPKLSHIPVVLLTGAFEPVDQARANQAGCDGVLAKPFEPQLVIGRVKELLARPRPAAEHSHAHLPEADYREIPVTAAVTNAPSLADNAWAPVPPERTAAPFAGSANADHAPDTSLTGEGARAELNDYFDRLDAAFSNMSTTPPAELSPAAAEPLPAAAEAPPTLPEPVIDWFASPTKAESGAGAPWDLPIAPPAAEASLFASEAAGRREFDRLSPIETSTPVESVSPAEPAARGPEPIGDTFASVTSVEPVAVAPALSAPAAAAPALDLPMRNPPPLPPLADAFAALLAAEQGDGSAAGVWPASPPAPPTPPAPPAIGDDVLEEITRRVLARLSDSVVRDAVTDAASKVAERLILEEIERIKASIK